MKKIISLFLIYVINSQLLSQQLNVSFSESQGGPLRAQNYTLPDGSFIGMKYMEDDKPTTAWVKLREKISIFLFNANMKPVKEKKMANGERAFHVAYTVFKKVGNKFWLIYTEPGDNYTLGDFKAVEINPVTLEASQPKTIASPNRAGFKVDAFTFIDRIKIELKSSPDGKYGCLFISAGKKNGFLSAVDSEFNSLWSKKEIETDIADDPADVNSLEVDNRGNIYLGYTTGELGHVAVYKSGNAPQILDIKLDIGKPKEVLVLAHKNSFSITITGGYFEGSRNVRGIFKGNIDALFKVGSVTKTPFTDDIVKLFDNDDWGSTKPTKYGIESIYKSQIFEVDNDIVDMVIEIRYESYLANNSMAVHTGDILNVYFGNEGKTSFTRIPKHNPSSDMARGNYYAMPFQKKMIIFYNDNPTNLSRDINASPKKVEEYSVLVAAIIDPDESVHRHLLLDVKQNYMGLAEWIKPVAENHLQMPLYFKRDGTYATISIE